MVMKYDKSVLFNILTSIYGKLKSILMPFLLKFVCCAIKCICIM